MGSLEAASECFAAGGLRRAFWGFTFPKQRRSPCKNALDSYKLEGSDHDSRYGS